GRFHPGRGRACLAARGVGLLAQACQLGPLAFGLRALPFRVAAAPLGQLALPRCESCLALRQRPLELPLTCRRRLFLAARFVHGLPQARELRALVVRFRPALLELLAQRVELLLCAIGLLLAPLELLPEIGNLTP